MILVTILKQDIAGGLMEAMSYAVIAPTKVFTMTLRRFTT